MLISRSSHQIPIAAILCAAILSAAAPLQAAGMMAATTGVETTAAETMGEATMAATTRRTYRGVRANFRYQPSAASVLRKMRWRVAASTGDSTFMRPGSAVLVR